MKRKRDLFIEKTLEFPFFTTFYVGAKFKFIVNNYTKEFSFINEFDDIITTIKKCIFK